MSSKSGPGEIRSIEAAVDAQITALTKEASRTGSRDEDLTYLIEKIRKRRSLLTIKPEFTPEVVGIAKQIIAFGGAGFGFVITFGQNIPKEMNSFTVGIALLYINITLISMMILIWFFCQARTRYPWLYLEKMGSSDQYFYYSAIPMDYRFRPFYLINRDVELTGDLKKYLNNLSEFAQKSINESKLIELKNELIQYHLLVFYQGYLDQYEQQLTHIALYGFGASVISAIIIPAFL